VLQVLRYNADGSFDGVVQQFNGTSDWFSPYGLTFGPDGRLYVSGVDLFTGQGQVRWYEPDSSDSGIFTTGLVNPGFITALPEPTEVVLLGLAAGMLQRRRR